MASGHRPESNFIYFLLTRLFTAFRSFYINRTANLLTGGHTVFCYTKCLWANRHSMGRMKRNYLLQSRTTMYPIRRVWVKKPKMCAKGWDHKPFNVYMKHILIGILFVCLFFFYRKYTATNKEPTKASWMRRSGRRGCSWSFILPPHWLGENWKPWSATTVQTKNR